MSNSTTSSPSILKLLRNQFPLSVRRRLAFLILGNLILLGYIFYSTQQRETSFLKVLTSMGPNVAPVVLASLGMTGLIFCGTIDLSIGAIIAVCASAFGILHHYEFPPMVCYLGCFSAAVLFSCLNGWLIRGLKISPIILTLAGLTFYRGVALIIAHASIADFPNFFPIQDEAYQGPGKFYSGWIVSTALVGAVLWELFGRIPRMWLAIGCSPDACRRQGVNVERYKLIAFLVSGLFLGLAALTNVTNIQSIKPGQIALGFELAVIGAVVLGGTNIFGGQGSYIGSALGASFLYLVSQTLIYAGVDEFWRVAIQGAVIIVVIGIDCWLHKTEKMLEELR